MGPNGCRTELAGIVRTTEKGAIWVHNRKLAVRVRAGYSRTGQRQAQSQRNVLGRRLTPGLR